MASPLGSAAVVSATFSGVRYIDGLLPEGTIYKWAPANPDKPLSGTVLTYSFPEKGSAWSQDEHLGYGPQGNKSGEPWNGLQPLTLEQRAGFEAALAAWAEVANLTFVEVMESESEVGDLRVTGSALVTHDKFAIAWAYLPSPGAANGGDIWIDPLYSQNLKVAPGDYGFETYVHELGHALGLGHSFREGPYDKHYIGGTFDSTRYSVMSYVEYNAVGPRVFASGPMIYDIAAVQYLYGANMQTRAGDTVYAFSNGDGEFRAIWDAGGHDVFDLSNQTRNTRVDIEEGGFSSIGQKHGGKALASNNISIAFGVAIEDVVGGAGDDVIFGNKLANALTGGAGSDAIDGRDENDLILGEAGNDKLLGGLGDDLLEGGEGRDALYGGAGDDRLDGGVDKDVMSGGAGNDVYVLDAPGERIVETANQGHDRVESATVGLDMRGKDIEEIRLLGALALQARGNRLDNQIQGNAGANILDGDKGVDVLIGGDGDDVYLIDRLEEADAAHVVELENGGSDWLVGAVLLPSVMIAHVENYRYTGARPWTFAGDDGANALSGGRGADRLSGGGGNDILDGGAGGDELRGGLGDDVFIVDTKKDLVLENPGEGRDRIESLIAVDLNLEGYANVEDVLLRGKAGLSVTGNALENSIIGNAGANKLAGGDGADFLSGEAGNDMIEGGLDADSLLGGAGRDRFVYHSLADGGAGETVGDFATGAGGDILDLSAVLDTIPGKPLAGPIAAGYLDFSLSADGADTIVSVDVDGLAAEASFVTLVTLQGTVLTAADAINLDLY